MEKNTGVYKHCISFRLEVRGNDCKCLFECNARAMGGNQREVRRTEYVSYCEQFKAKV